MNQDWLDQEFNVDIPGYFFSSRKSYFECAKVLDSVLTSKWNQDQNLHSH